jgi:Zn-dependent peptidase ImmA (M78 family)
VAKRDKGVGRLIAIMSRVATFLRQLPLSPDEIAIKSRLPSERVRAFLNGEDPTLADLRALARGLKVPLRSFASENASTSEFGLLFRQTTSSRPDRGVEAAAAFVEAALKLLPIRAAPPDWLLKFRFEQENYEEAARLADEFRQMLSPNRLDDPLIELPQLIIDRGVILGRLETSRFEGASVVADGYPFVFVSPRFSGRMLFTLAHEVGHLITHHRESARSVTFDLAGQIGRFGRYRSQSEYFVNAFASVLLLPARGVGKFLQQVRKTLGITNPAIGDIEILYLSRFYGVSFEVAARRCEDLQLLPSGGAKSLSDYLRDNFDGPEKRASSLGLPNRENVHIPRVSQNLLKVAAQKVEQGEASIGWVTDRLNCSVNDVYGSRVSGEGRRGSHH